MSPILNHTDPLLVTSHLRHANLTKLMDEVRQKDCFLLRPPPSKLSGGADTYANAMLIDLWMMIPADSREHQWLSFFEANPEILQTTSTVEDFLTKYHAQTQETALTQPGAFATANTVNPEGDVPSKKRKRDGTSGDDNDEDPTDASQHRSLTSRVPVVIDPALLEEDEQRELARKKTKASRQQNTPSSHPSSTRRLTADAVASTAANKGSQSQNQLTSRNQARHRNPPAPTGQAHTANIRRTATTSSSNSRKGRTKAARPVDDEGLDDGALADDEDPPVQSARARRKARNDAVSAKKAVNQLQAEAEDSRAKKERCLSMLGPKRGGGWTPQQLELDTEIAAAVRNKANRLCGFTKANKLPGPMDAGTVDKKGNPHLQYDFSCDIDYYGNQETVELVANSIWEDEEAAPVLKAAGQPYFTLAHLLKHVKEYFRNLRTRYARENDLSKQTKANEKNQVARHSNRQQTLAKNRLAAIPALCDEYAELNGEMVEMVVKADWMSDAWSGPDWDSDDEAEQGRRKAWLHSLGADIDRQTRRPSARFYRNKKIWEVLEQKWRVSEFNWLMFKLDECIELGKVDIAVSTERVRATKKCTQTGDILRQSTRRWPRTAPPASLIRRKYLPKHPDPDAELVEGWGEWDNPKIEELVELVATIKEEELAERQRLEDEEAAEAAAKKAKHNEKRRREAQRTAQLTREEGTKGGENDEEIEYE